MRKSALALVLLALAGGAGYAAMNTDLIDQARPQLERAVAWGRGLLGSGQPSAERAAAAAPAPQGPGGGQQGRRPTSVPVEIARAEATKSESAIRSVGTLTSDESVKISVEQAGRIAEIRFKEGDTVKAGEVLVRLDDALLKADLADAQAKLSLAESNFRRASSLSRTGIGTERSFDEARAALDSARAAAQLAQVRLSKAEVTAPFDGTVGLRLVSLGAFVQPGQEMVNLEKIDVLKVDFKVPETVLAQVRPGQQVEIAVDAFPERRFTGAIYAINPQVDVNGRALSIRARLDNKDGVLRPGLFARIAIRRQAGDRVVIVPEGAIVPRGNGPVVFRVQEGKAVETRVELGERRAGAVEIVSGVAAEDVVVVAGHARLRNGAAVEVVTPQARNAS